MFGFDRKKKIVVTCVIREKKIFKLLKKNLRFASYFTRLGSCNFVTCREGRCHSRDRFSFRLAIFSGWSLGCVYFCGINCLNLCSSRYSWINSFPPSVLFQGYHFGSRSSSHVNRNCRFVRFFCVGGTNLWFMTCTMSAYSSSSLAMFVISVFWVSFLYSVSNLTWKSFIDFVTKCSTVYTVPILFTTL